MQNPKPDPHFPQEKANYRGSALLALAILCTALAGGCAVTPQPGCATGQQQVNEMLYFGTDIQGTSEVSAADWQEFIEQVVTPLFPQGLTTWPANGQWRMASGEIIQEGTFVLSLIHAGEPGRDADVTAIMETYKTRFHQEAVLRVQNVVCVSL